MLTKGFLIKKTPLFLICCTREAATEKVAAGIWEGTLYVSGIFSDTIKHFECWI